MSLEARNRLQFLDLVAERFLCFVEFSPAALDR
jgi:hypothetical protein